MRTDAERACMVGDEIVSLPHQINDLTAQRGLFGAIVFTALFSTTPTPHLGKVTR